VYRGRDSSRGGGFRSGPTGVSLNPVAEATDGREAVELTLRYRPDIALLDIRMPRLDGLAAAQELRQVVPGTSP